MGQRILPTRSWKAPGMLWLRMKPIAEANAETRMRLTNGAEARAQKAKSWKLLTMDEFEMNYIGACM